MEERNRNEAAPGLWKYSFDSFEEVEAFFVESWKSGRFKGMSTKVIGTQLYAWEKKEG